MRRHLFAFLTVVFSAVIFFTSCGSESKNSALTSQNISEHSLSDVFEVIDFLPGEELPANATFPTIQVQFSEPVIALQELGTSSDKSPYISIEPPLKGTYRWFGTSLLSFVASEEIIPQKVYKVKVAPDIVSASGKKLNGKNDFTFHTSELRISSLIPGFEKYKNGKGTTYYSEYWGVKITDAMDFGISFNAPVNPEVIAKHLTITSEDGKAYKFTAEASGLEESVKNAANIVRIKLIDSPREGEKIKITLPSGSTADNDTFATTEDDSEILPIRNPLGYESYYVYSDQYGCKNYLSIYFNSELKAEQTDNLLKLISFDKDIKITKDNIGISYSSIILYNLPVDYNSSFKLTINPGVEDDSGRKTAEPVVLDVTIPPAEGYVRYKSYSSFTMLEAKYTPRLALMHRNISDNAKYTLTPLTDFYGQKSNKSATTTKIQPGAENVPTLETIELSDSLTATESGKYHGAVKFSPSISYKTNEKDWRTGEISQTVRTSERDQIIQVTDLGITVRYGYNQAAVLVTSLETGKPVPNAKISAYLSEISTYDTDRIAGFIQNINKQKTIGTATTDSTGLGTVTFDNYTYSNYYDNIYIRVQTDDDCAIFNPSNHNRWNSSVTALERPASGAKTTSHAFIFTDRGLYKPGETVTFRVIDRNLQKGKFSPYVGKYKVNLTDPWWWDATVYQTREGKTTANGSAWSTFKIPEDMKPGEYCISYWHNGDDSEIQRCYFRVAYFEAAKFEVVSSINSDTTYYTGDTISAKVSSRYLGGGSMGESSYSAFWERSPSSFNLDGEYQNLSFGPVSGYYDGRTDLDNAKGTLDGTGSITLTQKTGGEKIKGLPYKYTLQTTVTDSGNQEIASRASATVHPAKFYIGLSDIKNISGFAKKNTELKFDYVCVTPEGKAPDVSSIAKSAKLKMELLHEEWEEVNQIAWNGEVTTRYSKKLVSDKTSNLNLTATGKKTEISVTPEAGGAYILRLSTEDSQGNEVISEQSFYVTGSDWYWFSRDNAEEITLKTDKPEYNVGETAHILMQSPLPKGTYLITLEREGLFDKQVKTITEPTSVLDFQVKEDYVPIMYVAVSSFSTRTEEPSKDFATADLGKPKSYFGLTAINVNTKTRTFNIDIKTDKDVYEPGSTAKIKIHASTKAGPLKNAEVTLMAVDRGVIDLINYHVSNPLEFFYDRENFPECVDGGDNRSILIDPVTYTKSSQVGGDKGSDDIRKNFNPLALFNPSLITDANGDAECTFKLPDSLTTYRVTAIGTTTDKFSVAENEFDVANILSVRSVLPRQLRLNDKSEIGVTISNLDTVNHDLTVTAKITSGVQQYDDELQKLPGLITVEKEPTKTLSVPANSTKTLLFDVTANTPGWVTVEFEVHSTKLNERIQLPLQVEKPYIFETTTTIGSTEGTQSEEVAEERIIIPADAEDNVGSLYIQLDPTRLGILKEAVDYTFHYPYGCMEQRSSAILPLIAFGDYIKAFGLDSEVKKPKSVIEKEIASWASSQLSDGGFPYWPSGKYSSPYVSSRIAEILGIANQKGYKTASIETTKLARYLKKQAEQTLSDYEEINNNEKLYYLYDAAHTLYAASMLEKIDGLDILADRIIKDKKIDSTTTALCGLIFDNLGLTEKRDAAVSKLKSQISLTAQGADLYDVNYDGYWSIYNDASEKYALALQLLTRTNPSNSTIQHIVFELLKLQKLGNGYWKSTSATARVLTAFDEYIRTNNLTDLDFTAEVLLNKKSLAKNSFKGVGAEPVDKTLAFDSQELNSLPRNKELDLLFKKKGTGRLFYTASLKYAIPPTKQYAREEGICIFTEITDLETNEKVTGDELIAGNSYKMKVYVSSTHNREYVALRAPVPAGCEILNAAFVTTGTIPAKKGDAEDHNYNYGLSYEGIYNSEVQYFWDYFPRGHQEVEYAFRAVRKGEYNTPSATAECMYEPEIYGRSSGKTWSIK